MWILGQRIANLWLARGERVLATTRSSERAMALSRQGIVPVVCDVLQPDTLTKLPMVESLVYCVGFDRSAGVPMSRVYVEGLGNFHQALPGSPRLVYVSSVSVYGQTDGSEVDESACTEPPEESGRVVLAAENTLRQARPAAMILRFAGIYGPDRLMRARDVRAGTPLLGDPEKWLNLIHVEDGARAVVAAVELGQAGRTYNICDNVPVRRRTFYARMAEHLRAPAVRWEPPVQPLPSSELANRRISNRRMREELGVSLLYPGFEEGLAASKAG